MGEQPPVIKITIHDDRLMVTASVGKTDLPLLLKRLETMGELLDEPSAQHQGESHER